MRKMRVLGVLCFAMMFLLAPSVLFAGMVSEVDPDGTLRLEDGKTVSLAGIQMDAEGVSVLRVLAQKQDVRIEILRTVQDKSGGECAYAYLNAKSINFPFKLREAAGEKEIMLNEFLISIGAAKVDMTQEFAQKKAFLRIQEEAKKKGEGVWSYVGS